MTMQPSQKIMLAVEATPVLNFNRLYEGIYGADEPFTDGVLAYLEDEAKSWRVRQLIVEAVIEAIEACDCEIRRLK